ncbi:MAG: aldo/keto reductase [Alphaproteobacteria bacterium]
METTRIDGTGLAPTRIGLGTWVMGGWMWGGVDDDAAVATIHAALEQGVTLIDTAPVYGMGHAERLVGRALAESGRRDEVVLSTKAGLDWEGTSPFRDASRRRLVQEIDESRERLGTDAVDILHVHWPDPLVPIEETADAMREIFEAGKTRAVGVSNFSVEQIERFRAHCPLHVVQPPYNLFERGIEAELLPHVERNGMTTLTYGALCRGLLSGKIDRHRDFSGDDLRQNDPKFQEPRFAQYLDAVQCLDALAKERFGKDVIHLALRWLLDRPGVGVALWGARRPDQLAPLADVEDFRLDDAAMAAIDRILAETIRDPVGPEFMAPPTREARAA